MINSCKDASLPKTEAELELWMKRRCCNFNSYSINGSFIYEGFGIDKIGGNYIWFYTERGKKSNLKYFPTEEEIIAYACEQILNDKWAHTHCIGFTTSKEKSLELANQLQNLAIEYFQDQIPYYGLHKPVFRTFVFGCNIKKVETMKDRYYEIIGYTLPD